MDSGVEPEDRQSARGAGVLRRAWSRVLDGERAWGSLDVWPSRFGITRYRLVVFPPGLIPVERRLLRLWRIWPAWGAVLWIAMELVLGSVLAGWTALAVSTTVYLGVGVAALVLSGNLRSEVRTLSATVAGAPGDPQSSPGRAELELLAGLLLRADELHEQGKLSAIGQEAVWWDVYDQMATTRWVPTPSIGRAFRASDPPSAAS
jgi:hypothetical protein